MVAFFSVASAFLYALSNFLTQVGMRRSNPKTAVLMNLVSGLALSITISLFVVPIDQFFSRAVYYFSAAGIISLFIARYFLYTGIDRVGSPIASALYQTKPLFAAIAAVLVLDERFTLPIAAGMTLMMLGTAAISLEQSGGQVEKKWSKKDLIFPITAGAWIGVSQLIRKMGLNITPQPVMGVTVQNGAALILFSIYGWATPHGQKIGFLDKRAWVIFSISGVASMGAQMCLFGALQLGHVVIVSPIVALEPFFVLLLAGFFLKKVERVTCKIVLGSILIVAGAIVLVWKA